MRWVLLVVVSLAMADESREAALKELLEDARAERELEAEAERDASQNDARRARAAERAEEGPRRRPPPPRDDNAEKRESLLSNESRRRRPTLTQQKKDSVDKDDAADAPGTTTTTTTEGKRKKKKKKVPSNVDELYEFIAEGERAQSEAQRRERARVYGSSPRDAERRDRAYRSLSRGERRAVDAEVDRILRAVKKGYYAVLGLRRSCRTSSIKQRYRAKALVVHPDANESPLAPEAFDALRRAHETLADPLRRAEYDRKLVRVSRQKRVRLRRELSNLVETASEYVRARWDQFPLPFLSAGLLAFILIF